MRPIWIGAVCFSLGLITAAWAATVGLRPEVFVATAWNWTATQTFDSSHKITGLPTPSASSDAATKGYVDGQVNGGTITLNAGTNVGLTAPGAMSLGNTYTFGSTSDTPRFAGRGLGGAATGANK